MEGIQMDDVLLTVQDLTVEYKSDDRIVHAVNGVSFRIRRGETLGLVGETGAGKTSVAKAILKILPEPQSKITSGAIIYEGQDILKMNNADLRKIRGHHISMIFQDPMTALNPVMRVGNQIAEGIQLHSKVSKKEAQKRAVEMLKMVGISEDRYREYPHQFSGGMKQRVVIAMALACNPDLLLADEPTTALDVTIQAQVLKMIRDLKDQKNTSMILITHDLGIVAGSCDNVAVTYAGEIVEYGSKEEIFIHANHPYTLGLFDALPDMESDAERLSPIAGMPPDPSELPAGCKFAPRCPYATPECSQKEIQMQQMEGTHQCRCIHTDVIAKRKVGK
jgi:peptide/nickel transport system ATP-binding protein